MGSDDRMIGARLSEQVSIQVTLWLNFPAHHLAPVLRGLGPTGVRVVFMRRLSSSRQAFGWENPDLSGVDCIYVDGDQDLVDRLAARSEGINIVGGFGDPLLGRVWRVLGANPSAWRALILEAGVPLGLKGLMRPFLHTFRAVSDRGHIMMVLAMGEQGVSYYIRCGYPADRIYPFMYQCADAGVTSTKDISDPVRLVYVGGFSRRKGVDLLLHALACLTGRNWLLTVIGGGAGEAEMRQLAARLGIDERINWRGVVSSTQVVGELAAHDLCVVPSRFDGWGMAVNEAVEVGLAVLCTPRVGSKDLVISTGTGRVAARTSATSLAVSLAEMMDAPLEIAKAKAASRRLRHRLRGDSVANYLLQIIDHAWYGNRPCPTPPWRISETIESVECNY